MFRSIVHILPSHEITRTCYAFIRAPPRSILARRSNLNTYPQNIRLLSTTTSLHAMNQASGNTPNRLINSKSPYLLQHAYNPVDWYEWSEEAFTKASELNKPIFLSVGYSACHWCHVLAHESFEDSKIADVMNKNFINIKVDREERPDVDRLYMTFVQATSGRGGWPMSVWLTPELTPFFAGTYFPKEAFKVLCERIAQTWQADSSKVRQTGTSVIRQLQDLFKAQPRTFDVDVDNALKQIYDKWKSDFDPVHAGFGDAPKFPSPSMTFYPLLRFAYYSENATEKEDAVQMVSRTLLAIHNGGINDHVGKGIARYSVDAEWRLPHFEKMLYDQAQLITYALECSSLVQNPTEKQQLQIMALDIIEYTARDLRSPDGAFYSSEDADSLPYKSAPKTKEGAFYVWKKETIDEVLGDRAPMFEAHFGVEKEGNIDPKHDAHDELSGENQLYIRVPIVQLAEKYGLSVQEAQTTIRECLLKLRQYRENTRPRPHLDDKVVTAWNGLMLSALARSASVFRRDITFPDEDETNVVEKVLNMAKDLASFIRERLWDDSRKELCRSWRQGRGPAGMCEDYAGVIAGFLDLYEATGREDYVLFAFELQKRQDQLFWDEEDGGYFASPAGDKRILVRLKDSQDGAEPSALSVSLSNLYRLSSLITVEEYDLKSKAERTLSSQSNMIAKAPYALGMMVGAAKLGMKGMKEIVITGSPHDEATMSLLYLVRSKFVPNRSLIFIDPDAPPIQLAENNQVVRSLVANLSGKTTASLELPEVRICEAGICGLPLKGVELESFVMK